MPGVSKDFFLSIFFLKRINCLDLTLRPQQLQIYEMFYLPLQVVPFPEGWLLQQRYEPTMLVQFVFEGQLCVD